MKPGAPARWPMDLTAVDLGLPTVTGLSIPVDEPRVPAMCPSKVSKSGVRLCRERRQIHDFLDRPMEQRLAASIGSAKLCRMRQAGRNISVSVIVDENDSGPAQRLGHDCIGASDGRNLLRKIPARLHQRQDHAVSWSSPMTTTKPQGRRRGRRQKSLPTWDNAAAYIHCSTSCPMRKSSTGTHPGLSSCSLSQDTPTPRPNAPICWPDHTPHNEPGLTIVILIFHRPDAVPK